ncbi:MAG: polysaccharide deacetylase family protein [Desulfuromonas sp.]|nr:polysaccharide deacetylase family protein [Desulfuromonas sp.]
MIKIYLVIVLIFLFSGCAWASGQANIFVYHRFGDQRYPSTNISVETFASQLEYLHKNDYHVLYVSDIVQRIRDGVDLPPRCVALTVDDGYASFLSGAMPVLRQYDYPVTLFVSSASVGSGSYLNWEQLRQLQSEGVEIGNHSEAHPYFVSSEVNDPAGWLSKSQADIQGAQEEFKRHLGVAPTVFAYPYGEYSPALEALVQQLGFIAAFAQQSGVVDAALCQNSYYRLPRFPMGGPFATLEGFKNKATMRHLPVDILSPLSPVLSAQDPPEMVFTLDSSAINLKTLRCYVQGQDTASVEVVSAGKYRVCAAQPLAGRRNKYTLTAQGTDGQTWYWFSQLWIHP